MGVVMRMGVTMIVAVPLGVVVVGGDARLS
jgi:hypothetical protein